MALMSRDTGFRSSQDIPSQDITDLTLRPRRQLTLPGWICEKLGLRPGGRLELRVEAGAIILIPKKEIALDALRELQRILAEVGISEEELLANGRRLRERIYRERYARRET